MKSLKSLALSRIFTLIAGLFALLALRPAQAQTTGWNQTAGGTYDYNDTANWVGGTINGIWDSSLTLTGAQTIQFGADSTLTTALDFEAFGSQNIVLQGIGGAKTIILGGDITSNVSVNKAVTFGSGTAANNLNVNLGGVTRTFTSGTSKNLTFVNVISNGGVTTYGGTVTFSGINTYTGATTVNTGILALNGATGSSANSDFAVNTTTANSTTLQFNSTTNGNTGATRAKSVTLNGSGGSNGAAVTASGNATANSNDVITNALTVVEGYAIVGVSANAARNAQLSAASFSREAGSSVLFRGSNLGVNTIASLTAGTANIGFTSAPTLVGSGTAGQTTIGIIAGAYGDTTSGGDGKTGGLVTYDSTYGVRLLNTATEYTTGITSGQTQADNVLYQRVSGGASQDTNLTAATTTINSLSFKITGTGTNSGVTISGDAGTTLKINSGVIYASQQVTTAAATDKMLISAPTLDLNGKEGVISVFTTGVSNGNTAAPLEISSVITNDGGNGVTFGGTGQTILTGSTASTYTGVTTLNSGILRLNKSVANIGLTTDLVINGGTLLKNSNAIADTASVTINGGSFVFDSTTSSGNNNHQETINNFTMNGGGVSNHGTGASFTINGNANLNAGNLIMNQGGDITVLGATTLNGGLLTAKESTSTTVYNGLTVLNAVNITNQASGTYTAIKLTSHGTNKGALLTFNGNVTFTGNGTNTNAVLIDSTDGALANQGVIALEGTRIFNIGNGAAAIDLAIVPTLQDGTTAGGLTKTGLGTLALNGASTFTGGTTVSAGTLLVNNTSGSGTGTGAVTVEGGILGGSGTISGAVTVKSGATLAPGNSPGLLTVGSLILESGSTTAFEIAGISTRGTDYDAITVTTGSALTLAGAFTIDFTNIIALDNTTNINLFGYTGTHSGDFSSLVSTGFYAGTWSRSGETLSLVSGGQTLTFSELTGNLTVVPEPATWALLAFSLTTVLVLRRRRA